MAVNNVLNATKLTLDTFRSFDHATTAIIERAAPILAPYFKASYLSVGT